MRLDLSQMVEVDECAAMDAHEAVVIEPGGYMSHGLPVEEGSGGCVQTDVFLFAGDMRDVFGFEQNHLAAVFDDDAFEGFLVFGADLIEQGLEG